MRTGAEYKESLRDGRNVWIMGEGPVEDLTTHPATRGLVDEYADWYDRHTDPEWTDVLMTAPDAAGERHPVEFQIPRSADDLVRLSKAIYAQGFVSAGNVTHTPTYGALISLGIADAAYTMRDAGGRLDVARAYRDKLAREGTFLTLTGGASILGDRFRDSESQQMFMRIVKETDAGLVINGATGMHTSTPFANDVYIGLMRPDLEQRAMFAVSVGQPNVRVIARKPAARYKSDFMSPLSSRFDELDGQLWLDNVLIPWEKVFAYKHETPKPDEILQRDRIFSWLVWHHQHSWLCRADFTLGLAIAATDAMGLKDNPTNTARLVELIIDAQTIRTCLQASTLEPLILPSGYAVASPQHMASAAIYTLRVRQRMSEYLREIPGSSLVITPTDREFEDPSMAADMERAFGGGRYTAKQRAALLNLIWDHVSSGLDGRESAFEMHASGGMPAWRGRSQRWFNRYNELANGVLKAIDLEMPEIDLESLRDVGFFPGAPRLSAQQVGAQPPAPRPTS